jgi:hypothetical protein
MFTSCVLCGFITEGENSFYKEEGRPLTTHTVIFAAAFRHTASQKPKKESKHDEPF